MNSKLEALRAWAAARPDKQVEVVCTKTGRYWIVKSREDGARVAQDQGLKDYEIGPAR